ncbi:hypothetical protein NR798_13385 [Archangium gephyra]|uniref:hypothetical protein n=1 Tax=Archangium gephyra TaxID=48 RepID=UPI0035D4298C
MRPRKDGFEVLLGYWAMENGAAVDALESWFISFKGTTRRLGRFPMTLSLELDPGQTMVLGPDGAVFAQTRGVNASIMRMKLGEEQWHSIWQSGQYERAVMGFFTRETPQGR